MSPGAAIVAVATATGRGGVGIVRVSSATPDLLNSITEKILRKTLATLTPRAAVYGPFFDAEAVLDKGLALYFPAPHSYTGEHVLELHGHGGPVVLQMLVQHILRCSDSEQAIRIAEPGEFTRRAFLNDKLDLTQAEAVADLIEASTEQAARLAAQSLTGVFSKVIFDLVERLTQLRMLVEATLDFPDEEIDFLKAADANAKLKAIKVQLTQILASASQGALLREGMHIVLMGEPNVGKSSLLNTLAQSDVAIVTPIAGTTRDKIVSAIQIEGVPLHIIDTAGLRETTDEVERMGIARTLEAIAAADAVVWLRDATAISSSAMPIGMQMGEQITAPVIEVHNKSDLIALDVSRHRADAVQDSAIKISAKTGAGIDALKRRLLEVVGWQPEQNIFLARERHLVALKAAQDHVRVALDWLEAPQAGLELMAEELRLAQAQLSSITGEFSADDLLGVIFNRFCIGK